MGEGALGSMGWRLLLLPVLLPSLLLFVIGTAVAGVVVAPSLDVVAATPPANWLGTGGSQFFVDGHYWGITKWLQPVQAPLVVTQSVTLESPGASQAGFALACPTSQMMLGRPEPIGL